MPKFAANLGFLFNEVPFLDRFAAAAQAGFHAVEFPFPYDYGPAELAAQLRSHGLQLVLFNAPPGDASAGERGIAALPGRATEFRAAIELALAYARGTGCRQIHVMAGLIPAGRSREEVEAIYVDNLRHAADVFARDEIRLLIEPLNLRDNPGYILSTTAQAIGLLDRVGAANVALQLDLYHCQVTEGDLAGHIHRLLPRTGHIQIAGNPGRNEPDRGEINYPFLFDLLDRLGYDGWIGCEYRPAEATLAGLRWAARWGVG